MKMNRLKDLIWIIKKIIVLFHLIQLENTKRVNNKTTKNNHIKYNLSSTISKESVEWDFYQSMQEFSSGNLKYLV